MGPITRRQALVYAAALGMFPLSLPGCGSESERPERRLVASRRDRCGARTVGRVWLETQQREPSAAELVQLICGDETCAEREDDVERLRRLIIERHLADFERGNLVSVRGWVMSETEVALYALVALEERSSV